MRTICRILVTLVTLFFGGIVPCFSAEEAPSLEELETRLAQMATVSDLVTYAYRKNPSIQAAREAWRATVENYRVATAYPDPQFMVTYFPEPLETRLGPQDWNATLSQMIPFPGKLTKAGEVVKVDASIARLKLDKAVQDNVVAIRASFHELWYIREAQRVAEHNAQLLDHLRKVGETAYAEDRAALVDMVRAQSQVGQLRYDVLLLEELELTEITRLNGLLNRPPDAAIGRLEPAPFRPLELKIEELYQLAETHQEEIRMAEFDVAKAGAQVDLARYQNLPDFKLGVFYAAIGNPDVAQDPPDAGDDAIGIQFGVTLPLWFGKNFSRLDRARAEMAKAQALKSARVNDIRTRIHTLFFRLQNARRLMDLYGKELLPQAAQSMEIAETWFQEGESSFADFIETQTVWYNFQLSLIRAQADYGKYLARLEGLVGESLTKIGIKD